ncbi:flagellar biosynthesis protein FlhF [Alteromonas oceanisediminis]|uniref:flagellar biosynthesis protein FlhF n=1 Tax=Alteromonas oceanisediminis TaxID=2836180 RepID=UPI001BD92DAE|nr:flagellar biosynthesis protein FlhF [Alteromonas oceanisediminis]MBT0584905.1 flagellar biosynthesis protein FlhF [Alteromonas oceanisediminis]
MKIRRFFGKDMREALGQVKDELGSDAVIMSTRKRDGGIELVAAYDKEPVVKAAVAKPSTSSPVRKKAVPTLSEIIGDDGPDSLRALLDKQREAQEQHQPRPDEPALAPAPAKAEHSRAGRTRAYETPEPDMLSADQSEREVPFSSQLNDMRAELASLRNVLSFQVAGLTQQQYQVKNPLHSYLLEQLFEMGIDKALAQQLVNYLPSEADERQAWLMLLKLIANRLRIEGQNLLAQSGVVALVGPTGTGKTTTVAKLAARYAQKYGAEHVAMVTIDTYRIAAFEQLATYGKIIGCTVKKAQSGEELADTLHQLRHKRMILIDTAGFSQRDARLIGQLNQFQHNRNVAVKYYLVAQASAQYATLNGAISAYGKIPLSGCILTKLDECYSLGEALSVAINHNLPLSFVTDGQKVPEDIASANAKNLISLAARLYKKYKLHHTSKTVASDSARAV